MNEVDHVKPVISEWLYIVVNLHKRLCDYNYHAFVGSDPLNVYGEWILPLPMNLTLHTVFFVQCFGIDIISVAIACKKAKCRITSYTAVIVECCCTE